MKNRPYKRKPGDYEIRILPDGRVVMIAPNEELIELAEIIDPNNNALPKNTENELNVRTTTNQTSTE